MGTLRIEPGGAERTPYVITERRTSEPQRDRIRLGVLAEIGQLFASDDDHHAVLRRVAHTIVPGTADRCTIYLRGKSNVLDRAAIARIDGSATATSQLAVPMIVRNRVLGVLQLCRTREPVYDRDDLAFAEEVARRIAMYVDHAVMLRDQAQLIRELEQSNRDLDQFVDVASHDLKAPLRGIANLAQMLEEDVGDRLAPPERERFALLRGRVRRLENMIDGVLRYSRAGRAVDEPPTRVAVAALAREVFELLAPPPEATLELAPNLPTLHTLRQPLEQVLLNLIGNALKHADRKDVRIAITAARTPRGWELAVSDNGPGISPELHDHVWQMFRALRRRGPTNSDAIVDSGCTGMGLAIVRRIVEAYGGRVTLESQPGAGATFRFTWKACA
jgi:signal transduction histidine kinase